MADVDSLQQDRFTKVVAHFASMNSHQRLIAVRALWVLFELDKQLAAERATGKKP